jgi:bacterioferritin-associated ferredoxin
LYLCSCKGLDDSDVRAWAERIALAGAPSVQLFIESLELDGEQLCGLCAQAPEQFAEIAVEEWTRLGLQFQALPPEDIP